MSLRIFLFGLLLATMSAISCAGQHPAIFDMEAIRDASTLDVDVVNQWHLVEPARTTNRNAPPPTRQKLINIHVCYALPGESYRVPVRLIVPANQSANGFYLTANHDNERLSQQFSPRGIESVLLQNGIGIVQTVIQEPGRMGLAELGRRTDREFFETLEPKYKVQYRMWPETLMRSITAACAEVDYFNEGRIAIAGGSKNGASPSMAVIHDERITAVFAAVSPIWDSPLRNFDRSAWDSLQQNYGPIDHPFLGGHFGPAFHRQTLAAGKRWEDLEAFAERTAEAAFISRNMEKLNERGVDLLFHPGTHDFVAYDLAWGGLNHPDIPLYLKANSGHGVRRPHPRSEQNERNKDAFLLSHFLGGDSLLQPPAVSHVRDDDSIQVSVTFAEGSEEQSGRIFWMIDRPEDGSPGYVTKMIPDDNWTDMTYNEQRLAWEARIPIPSGAGSVDFFSNHGKLVGEPALNTYISSPYTRVQLQER
ncbi:MAG: hypothetical protein AAF456_19610 [Planctomycetota bacterium]